MAEVIIMPKLGFNMSEGKLVRWYKQEGEPLKKGEPVFSIETDKTAIDIEATLDGVFRKKFIEEGDSVEVTLPIAIIGTADENIDTLIADVNRQLNKEESVAPAAKAEAPATATVPADAAPTAATVAAGNTVGGFLRITPRARRVAKENGLSITNLQVNGTGYDGGICEKDILAYLTSNKQKISPVAKKMAEEQNISLDGLQGTGSGGKIMKQDILGSMPPSVGTVAVAAAVDAADGPMTSDGKVILEETPYSGIRKVIGDRLSLSKFTAPHLYFTQKVNLEQLLDIRSQINKAQTKKTSVTDYIAKATIKTLQKFPEMNSALIGDKLVKYKYVNLGIAVAAPTGLIVPVVRKADKLSVVEISVESSMLFEKARSGGLAPSDYNGGTFTISNLGMFGIENFTAIINPPEAGILSISATKDEPFVEVDKDGCKSITIKPMMNITLSVDHRIIDGLLAAQFVTEVKRLLENPIELLI